MIEWWSSLSIVSQVFACIAVPATVVLLIQTISMFLGMDGDGNAFDGVSHGMSDADIGTDVDMDADFDADASDGIFGHGDDLCVDPDVAGLDGLRIFTVRGIIAFLVVFGWLGLALTSSGVKLWLSATVAAVGGFAMMVVLALLMRAVMKLRGDGNIDNRNALGVSGKVYLTVPASRSGEGKINIMLQGSYVERDAVTDEAEAIPTGCEVTVIGLSGQTTLVVKRK